MAVSRDGFWEYRPGADEGWYSPRVLEMLGRPAGPGHGGHCTVQRVEQAIHPDDLSAFRRALRRVMAGETGFSLDLRLQLAGQLSRWVRAHVHQGVDETGEALVYGTVQDIHAEKTATLALEALVHERTAGLAQALGLADQRRREAEAANAAKTHFLAQMSHELRTPLTGVLGMIELARRTPLTPPQQRYLDTANESAQSLLHVISDLLDLSRIESGQVELAQEAFDPARVMAHALRSVLSIAPESELAIKFDWVGDSPCLLGDPGALRQIATNLVSNAVKFTPTGLVALRGECHPLPKAPGHVALTLQVSDTGPGIEPAHRDRIFQPFVQGQRRPVRGAAGAGLGLAIAQRLADAMGASLSLRCPADGGTEITLAVTLPTAPDPRALPAPCPLPPGAQAWLVYGSASGGTWLEMRLRRLGWQCRLFASVHEVLQAVPAAGQGLPGMVLVGQSALGELPSLAPLREALPGVPMRLNVLPQWEQPALEAEAHALGLPILVAPLTPAQLARLHTSDVTLPDEADDRRLARPPSPAEQPEVLLVEDDPLNLLVSREYLQALGLQVREATTGADAVAACLAQPPALVLLDLQLTDMDGFAVSRRLRALQQQGAWPGAPIVALTAHAGTADRRACRAAGMDAMLTKPMSLAKLRRRLARWVPV